MLLWFIAVRSDQYELFWAFTPTIDLDGPLMQPVLGFEQSMVMHLTHYFMNSPSDVHAGLTISANRNGCTLPMVSGGVVALIISISRRLLVKCLMKFSTSIFMLRTKSITQFSETALCIVPIRPKIKVYFFDYPTPTPHKECQNGGIMSPNNTSCFCTPGFTGTYCEHIVCYNGGTPQGLQCNCVPGWSGEFCEFDCSCYSSAVLVRNGLCAVEDGLHLSHGGEKLIVFKHNVFIQIFRLASIYFNIF
uniref:EGF-like domain-containing protein n=1 Tax=Heterorhabditis bacteriophora TaxID=37862 RepID=A0A1I7XVP9_HETBA